LELEQAKTAAVAAGKAILDKAKAEGRGITPEEKTSLDGFMATAESAIETISSEKRMAELAAAAQTADGGGGRTGGRVEITERWLEKPFGPEIYTNDTPRARKAKLAIGFGEQLLAIRNQAFDPASADQRLFEINRRGTPSGASEQVPSDGGFLVYPDFSEAIESISHETGLVYQRGRKMPISATTNAIKIPGIDEQSRADGSRWGGIRMYWQNEADALTGSKPKFRLIQLELKKLTGLFYATDEIIADTGLLGSTVTQGFGEELGFKLDDAAINGDGLGKPQGILGTNALITVNKETGQVAATLTFENVKKMYYRLHARSRKNAVWFVNQDVEQQLLSMSQPVGTGGSSVVQGVAPMGPGIYVPPGVQGNDNAILFGRPVIPIEQCQTLGTKGDIILADMSQWVWIDKGALQQAVSMHVQFLTDQMTFRWIYRVDGQSVWHTPLAPFAGSNTQSPFIALQTRS
jgi:HK97 family phage major capsid protein